MIYIIQNQDAVNRYLQMFCYSETYPQVVRGTFIGIFRIMCIGLKFNF